MSLASGCWVSAQGGSQALVQAQDVEAKAAEYLRSWLPERLLERLFQMTQAITTHVLVGAVAPEAQFPQLPGSHLSAAQLGTPALAFVRTVCHVLALDASVEDEVRTSLRPCATSSYRMRCVYVHLMQHHSACLTFRQQGSFHECTALWMFEAEHRSIASRWTMCGRESDHVLCAVCFRLSAMPLHRSTYS